MEEPVVCAQAWQRNARQGKARKELANKRESTHLGLGLKADCLRLCGR